MINLIIYLDIFSILFEDKGFSQLNWELNSKWIMYFWSKQTLDQNFANLHTTYLFKLWNITVFNMVLKIGMHNWRV